MFLLKFNQSFCWISPRCFFQDCEFDIDEHWSKRAWSDTYFHPKILSIGEEFGRSRGERQSNLARLSVGTVQASTHVSNWFATDPIPILSRKILKEISTNSRRILFWEFASVHISQYIEQLKYNIIFPYTEIPLGNNNKIILIEMNLKFSKKKKKNS